MAKGVTRSAPWNDEAGDTPADSDDEQEHQSGLNDIVLGLPNSVPRPAAGAGSVLSPQSCSYRPRSLAFPPTAALSSLPAVNRTEREAGI